MIGRWLCSAMLLWMVGFASVHAAPADGGSRATATGGFEVFDAQAGQWLAPEAFWLAWAARRGGLTHGRGAAYPPYASVREFDTFLVEIDGQTCLMEFFHTRWRRANDVRRWNDAFNSFGACGRVFD
jgi:hypothetical protein